MITSHRPSILKRPLRQNGNLANVENMEKEYQKEQARIRSHATWKEDTEERMRKSNYGVPTERAEMQQEMAEALRQQVAMQRARDESMASSQRNSFPENHTSRVPQDMSRPWTGTTSQLNPQQEAWARQRAEAANAEANRTAVARRAALEQEARQKDVSSAQQALQSEDSFWNRGASSDRWVAPELRPRSCGTHPHSQHATAAADRPPPYTWSETSRPSPAEVLARAAAIKSPVVAPYSTHDSTCSEPSRPSQQGQSGVLPQTARQSKSPAPFWTAEDDINSDVDSSRATQHCAKPKKEYLWSWDT